MMGSAVHLHMNVMGKDAVIIVQTIDLQGSVGERFRYGNEVAFSFGGNVCHVFGKDGSNLEF